MPNKFDAKSYHESDAAKDWEEANIEQPNTTIGRNIFTSQSFYSSMWEKSGHGVVIFNDKGEIVDANPFFYTMIGCTPAEVEKHTIYDLMTLKNLPHDYTNIESLIKGRFYSFETDDVLKKKFDTRELIKVKVIACRIPSALNEDFQYIVAHIYELESGYFYNINDSNTDSAANKSWVELIKELVFQKWFVYSVLAFLSLLVVMASLTGNLAPLIERVFERIEKVESGEPSTSVEKPHGSDHQQ